MRKKSWAFRRAVQSPVRNPAKLQRSELRERIGGLQDGSIFAADLLWPFLAGSPHWADLRAALGQLKVERELLSQKEMHGAAEWVQGRRKSQISHKGKRRRKEKGGKLAKRSKLTQAELKGASCSGKGQIWFRQITKSLRRWDWDISKIEVLLFESPFPRPEIN